MFKNILILFSFILLFFNNSAKAQITPDGILFQAVARDVNGNAAAGRNIYAKVTILKGTATGTVAYAESFKVVSSDDGIFTIIIGKGTRTSGATGLASIAWNDAFYFVNIKIAIEPSLPTPGWNVDNEYVDMGTSQLWSVPYALFATKSSVADSAMSISTIVPGSKGGTGVNNEGKTITLAQNLNFKGVGDITITTTGVSNVSLPLTGLLANTQYVSDRIAADTVSLSNRIDALGLSSGNSTALKLNIADTASMLTSYLRKLDTAAMLNPYLRKIDTASLSKRIDIKLDSAQIPGIIAPYLVAVSGVKYSDTAAMLSPYAIKFNTEESINTKVNISDTATMLSPYAIKSNTIASINTKVNISDTATMLSKYYNKTATNDRLNLKVNNSDTATMLSPYAIKSNTITSINTKVNISDTSNMLSKYYNKTASDDRFNLKVNTSDTSSMLSTYAIKSNTIASINTKVNISDTSNMLSKYAIKSNTIASINAKVNITDTSNMLSKYYNKTASDDRFNLKVNFSDTSAMLSKYYNKTATTDRLNLKVNISDTSVMLSKYYNKTATNDRLNLKINITDTSNMLSPYAVKANTEASIDAKVNLSDTSDMLSKYYNKTAADDRFNLKVNIVDTSNMLSKYYNKTATNDRLNLKVNISDTSDMLSKYYNKTATTDRLNLKVNISDTATMLSNRIARDTISLSNRINALSASSGGDLAAEITRATTAENLISTNLSTEVTRAKNKSTADSTAVYLKIVTDSTTLMTKIISDSTVLRDLINTNSSTISTHTTQISSNTNNIGINATNIATNTTAINERVKYSDTTGIVAPYLRKSDTVYLSNRINLKAPIASPTFSGTVSFPSPFNLGSTSVTTSGDQLNYLSSASGLTGSGNIVFSNAPTLVTPNIGTPSAGVATNLTGLPLTTGVTGILRIENGGTGSSTKNFVDLSADQDIGGIKTFTSNLIAGGTFNLTGSATLSNDLSVSGVTTLSTNTTIGGTLSVTGVTSFSAQPVVSTLTASKPVFTDVNKGLTSLGTLGIDQGGTGATTVADARINLDLNNVNNTADADKPVSTATQTALDAKENLSNKSTSITTDANSVTKYPSVKLIKDYVDGTISTATPDATTLVKGKIQLAGDLGGTASLPSVLKVGGSSASDINNATILSNAATENNAVSTIVKRDVNGDFTANNITANLLGNATNVTGIVEGLNGGTGVANNGKTITLGGNINTGAAFTTSGVSGTAFPIILKNSSNTNLTLPSSGTLATLLGTENFENKSINGLVPSSLASGFKIIGGTNSKTFTVVDDATLSGINTGDQTITLTGDLTGTGTGTFSTTLINSGVTAGNYGSTTQVPSFTVDAKGRVTAASNITISGVSSIGSALDASNIIVGDANNLAAKVAMSGDVTINNTGITTIGSNKITTSKISDRNITYAKIQNVTASDKVLGRVSAGTGVIEEIATTGTGDVVRSISPTFTGAPQVPTAVVSSNNGTIANTEFVTRAIGNISAASVFGVLPGSSGGTGVDNTGKSITLGGDLITSGTNTLTFTTTGPTNVTLPTSGTLATVAQLGAIMGGTFSSGQITGIVNPENGGTGIDNTGKTISLGGNINTGAAFTTTGTSGSSNASAITFKTTAASSLTLPTTGTLATLAGAETITNKTIVAGSNTITGITNANLSGSAGITDANLATIATAGKVENSATTATDQNTANAIVARDANGNFTANTITGNLNGNASTATKLSTSRTIYGNDFDGSANLGQVIGSSFGGTGNGFTKFIGATSTEKTYTLPDANTTILTTNALITPAQGGTGVASVNANLVFAGPVSGIAAAPGFRALTAADVPAGSGSYIANSTTQQASSNFNISGNGTIAGTLFAGIIKTSSGTSTDFLKADGTLDNNTYALAGANSNITSLTGLTSALSASQGGTGVNNSNKTITLGGDLVTTGNKLTLNSTSSTTNVTLPTSGTLATLTGSESLTNKSINGITPSALVTGFKISGGTTSKTLTINNNADIEGTNTGDVTLTGENYLTISGQAVTANAINLSGTNVTGTLAAARFPAISGDVVIASGTISSTIASNAITTSKIADANVTFAKIQTVGAKKLVGNKLNTSGTLSEIELGNGLSLDENTGVLTAVSSGITSVNTLSSTTQTFATGTAAGTANGFNIVSSGSTHTFNLPDASSTVKGVVNTGAQTFAGTKTIDAVNVKGALAGSTSSATISGFNAAINSVTSALTINGTNAADYNGKVLVCATGPTITFDGASLPIGFSCMVLQSDNTVVQFVGTVNRYNYAATSGIYAIATVMCYASGSVLLTGDVQ